MAQAIPALEIRDLHKRYGSLDVLKGISLTANDGDVISMKGNLLRLSDSRAQVNQRFYAALICLKIPIMGRFYFLVKLWSSKLIVTVS